MLLKPKNNNFKIFFFLDAIFISVILYVFIKLQYKYYYPVQLDELPSFIDLVKAHYKAYILIIFSWYIIADYINLYTLKRFDYLMECIRKILIQSGIFSVIVFTISGLKSDDLLSNKLLILFTLIVLIYLSLTRIFKYINTRNKFSKGKNLRNVIVIGENANSKKLIELLNTNNFFGLNIAAIFKDQIFDFEQLIHSINENNVKYIFIVQSGALIQSFETKLINYCEDNHITINYIPYSLNSKFISFDVNYIDTLPVYSIKNFPLEESNNQTMKITFDVLISSLVCVFVLSWMIPIIAILIKLDSKGDIIFKQKRRGLNGEIFDCYKFRTMYNDGTNSIQSTVINDSRVTKIGKFLRKTSLDEFPQFINVMKGEMSIVGPRPHMISQDVYYSEVIQKYNIRNYVKPGITGLAQIKGFRGAISMDKDMEDRIRADIFYVRNWSVLLDIQIIYQTIILMLKGDKNAI